MDSASLPRDYPDWRTREHERAEDAAHLFGYYLIHHCRDEALAKLPADSSKKTKAAVEAAVDTALHNLCDLLEGFFTLSAGPNHKVDLSLQVRVRNSEHEVVETLEISPCKLDLPIGFWKWAKEREFR